MMRLTKRVARGRSLEGVLWEMYHVRGMTQEEIGKALGCTTSAICKAMKRYGIPARRYQWISPITGEPRVPQSPRKSDTVLILDGSSGPDDGRRA